MAEKTRSWPTAEQVDAEPKRWWWVDGAPSRLSVDRMEHPHRVKWHARFVADLPVEMFGGPVLAPGEVPLGPAHRGMRIDLLGLLDDAKSDLARSSRGSVHSFSLRQLEKHCRDLATRFYAGDLGVVDEFLQLYDLDSERPKGGTRG